MAIIILASVLSCGIIFVESKNVNAVTGSDWNAGNIIDDLLFYDNNSMSTSDIQNFLNSKVSSCDTNGTKPASEYGRSDITHARYAALQGWAGPPYICLKDYYQVPRNDQVISNFTDRTQPKPAGSLSAAEIIKKAADTYGVSPKALLVTLQKESLSLIPDTWPLLSQYKNAMGYACADTSPCQPQYEGFYNQMMNASRQFKLYKDNPGSYRYKPFQDNKIYYNPGPCTATDPEGNCIARNPDACGSSIVAIKNYATAGLYNYTPYQPNQSALNNLYGSGDSCGAYGNRNFWRIYNDWFGSTHGDLVSSSDGGVYLIENGTKRPFPNEIIFLSYSYKWSNVVTISSTELSLIPDGAAMPFNAHLRDGHLVTSQSGGIYVIENGLKRPFPNEATFFSYSYKFSDALVISSAELSLIPDGAAMTPKI